VEKSNEIKSTEADRAVSDTVGKILRRGEEYLGELNRSCFGSEPKINEEQLIKLVSCADSEFTSLLLNVRNKSSAENPLIPSYS
jgi:hypothetical protein